MQHIKERAAPAGRPIADSPFSTRKNKPIPPAPQELPGESLYREFVLSRARLRFAEAEYLSGAIRHLGTSLAARRMSPGEAADILADIEARMGEWADG